jgi:hypothetical protein
MGGRLAPESPAGIERNTQNGPLKIKQMKTDGAMLCAKQGLCEEK